MLFGMSRVLQKLRLAFEMAFERQQLSCGACGLGVPLNEPDRDHDERTQGPRFSRAP
jgi:hypothetical protein